MRFKLIHLVAGLALLLGFNPTRASATILWGLDTNNDSLFTLDTNTGTVNTIGVLPSFSFGGLDFDSSGNLYALLLQAGLVANLYQVDPNNANAVFIGGSENVFESFEIIGNTGYSADVFEENLYSINLANGVPALIGSHNTDAGDNRITGLASDEATLFGTRIFDQDLVRLNLANGGVDAVIGVHGLTDSTSLAWDGNVFWTIPAFTGNLYSLNPANGQATLVRSGLNVSHVTGLTTRPQQVSEPMTLALLGLGLLSAAAYRRRKQN